MISASSAYLLTIPRRSALIALLLPTLLACGKKEPPRSGPELEAPDKAFSSMAGHSPEKIVPEAEVKSSSGPIQLTLRLYKIKIKAGDSIWYQIELKNVGKNNIRVDDNAFVVPGGISIGTGAGITLEVLGPDGKPLKPHTTRRYEHGPFPFEDESLSPEEQERLTKLMFADGEKIRKHAALQDELERKGLSRDELVQKLIEFDEQHAHIGTPPAPRRDDSFWLEPGAAAVTLPWANPIFTGDRRNPFPKPIGQFAELEHYHSTTSDPGRYQIRVAYDNRPSGWAVKFNKEDNINPGEDEILVITPLLKFVVHP